MITQLQLAKENFKFSAGHFTIFSATERENLHGHNFTVAVTLDCEIIGNGMTFDYGLAKRAVEQICRSLNETFLLPSASPFLKLSEANGLVTAEFNGETIPFLKRDVTILPLANITVEELARWILDQLMAGFAGNPDNRVRGASVGVYSGPGQGAVVRS